MCVLEIHCWNVSVSSDGAFSAGVSLSSWPLLSSAAEKLGQYKTLVENILVCIFPAPFQCSAMSLFDDYSFEQDHHNQQFVSIRTRLQLGYYHGPCQAQADWWQLLKWNLGMYKFSSWFIVLSSPLLHSAVLSQDRHAIEPSVITGTAGVLRNRHWAVF